MEIIKKHVSLSAKIIQIQCKNKCSKRFYGLRARTEHVSKHINNDTNIHPKINTKFMLEQKDAKT